MLDLASRVYNHNFRLDPIVRSLLDNDFYKFLMGQQIFKHHRDLDVTFRIHNRAKNVKLSDFINEDDLISQLDYVKSLRFRTNELIWLQGNTFYGKRQMFSPDYIGFLEQLELPDYHLSKDKDDDWIIEFTGKWAACTMWEIPALAVVNTLRNRAAMRSMSKIELDVLYSAAKTKLWKKLQKLAHIDELNLTDFGTRRRHDFLFQNWAVNAARDVLGDRFTGTSNTLIAMREGIEAKGTNAHEIPMILAALCDDDQEIKLSQYKACEEWKQTYDGALLIGLPDTFGSTQFFRDAPDWLTSWTGYRFDSKDPIIAGEEMINWLVHRGVEPSEKLGIFSDGLDVNDIIKIHSQFKNRMRIGFGWGTLFTNDFIGCDPRNRNLLDPISITCKAVSVNGRDTVKLSDNYSKASGPKNMIERYHNIFGISGISNLPVQV